MYKGTVSLTVVQVLLDSEAQRELVGRGATARLAAGQSITAGLACYVVALWARYVDRPFLALKGRFRYRQVVSLACW
jgi:hypothetical protein